MTGEKFLQKMKERGITVKAGGTCGVMLEGESDAVRKFQGYLESHAGMRQKVISAMTQARGRVKQSAMTKSEYLSELTKYGGRLELCSDGKLDMAGVSLKMRARMLRILDKNPLLKEEVYRYACEQEAPEKQEAVAIMMQAVRDEELLYSIQERACIRWAEGYSDSLFMAVMSGITETGEEALRDEEGKIILKAKTDWNEELSKYRGMKTQGSEGSVRTEAFAFERMK